MNTKKFIAILLCLVVVLTITAACSKDKDKDVTVYETDLWGETVTNDKGENVTIPVEGTSIEYVTDKNGNKLLDENGEKVTILHYYVNDVDDEGNVVTNANKEPVTQAHSSAPSTTASMGSWEDILNGDVEMSTVVVETMPEGTTVQTSERLYDKSLKRILASGKFYIEMKTKYNAEGVGIAANYGLAVSGNKTYMKTNMQVAFFNLTLEFIMNGDNMYILNSKQKVYMESTGADGLDEDMMTGDQIQEALGSSTSEYQKTSIVKSKGKTYICEEYIDNGTTFKYYFDQSTEELKRIEYDAEDGTTIAMDIVKLIGNPADSYFEVPAGYKKVDEDGFTNAMLGPYASLIGAAQTTTKVNG